MSALLPSDSALGGSPTETPMTYSLSTDYYAECERVSGLLVDFDGETRFTAISEHVADLIERLRAAREQNAAHEAEIARLSTPDVIGYCDEIGYAEENFDAIGEYLKPNGPSKLVWANRFLGDWHAVKIVTVWDEDGDIDEMEIRVFRDPSEMLAAIAESNARRPVASSSQETPNG